MPSTPVPSLLARADQVITTTWKRPVEELRAQALQLPVTDPALRAVMHIRDQLELRERQATSHLQALHRRSRPELGTPEHHEADHLAKFVTTLHAATVEAHLHLDNIGRICLALEMAAGDTGPEQGRTQAATARSTATRADGPGEPPAPPVAPAQAPTPAPGRGR